MPFILLSARAGDEARVEGLAAGADDYLAKPFSAKELIARVHAHIDIARMRSVLERRVKERTKELFESEARYRYSNMRSC
jgi:DNA-binding response OmpR family regulator